MGSFSWPNNVNGDLKVQSATVADSEPNPAQAEAILQDLAGVFRRHNPTSARHVVYQGGQPDESEGENPQLPNLEARYHALVEQIPAVVFIAYLDRGIGEAYSNDGGLSVSFHRRRIRFSPLVASHGAGPGSRPRRPGHCTFFSAGCC
jgi:hypothetical protein